MFEKIKADAARYSQHGHRHRILRAIVISPGFQATILFRIQEFLCRKNLLVAAYFFRSLNLILYGIDVLPGAVVGKGIKIDHPSGIVIGPAVVIGVNCTMMSGVVLGSKFNDHKMKSFDLADNPRIGNNVIIGTKATILGSVSISDNVIVRAHELVLSDKV